MLGSGSEHSIGVGKQRLGEHQQVLPVLVNVEVADHVVAEPALSENKQVAAHATAELVIAQPADQDVIAAGAIQRVVTGAAQGLGKGIARRLAEAGANVVIGDRNLPLAQETAQALSVSSNGKIIAQGMDVADADSIAAACARAEAELGGVDMLGVYKIGFDDFF